MSNQYTVNGWIIKKKPLDQVPANLKEEQCYSVSSPDGRCMEDNLIKEEAEQWCNNNDDYAGK